jgi:hypothetical protein
MELCSTLLKKELKVSVTESEQLMYIMQIAGVDAFADVQKQCTKLITEYAQSQPKSVDYACERMIRLTTPFLTHKHTAVRVSGIKVSHKLTILDAMLTWFLGYGCCIEGFSKRIAFVV